MNTFNGQNAQPANPLNPIMPAPVMNPPAFGGKVIRNPMPPQNIISYGKGGGGGIIGNGQVPQIK